MKERFPKISEIREYLLGQITEEKRLEEIEELIFSNDDDFLNFIRENEEQLIEDYLSQQLTNEDRICFEKNFLASENRRQQLKTSIALQTLANEKIRQPEIEKTTDKNSFWKWFFRPQLAFGVLLTAFLGFGLFYFIQFREDEADKGLARLKEIYAKQRPLESRQASLENYAPFSVTRGEEASPNSTSLKLVEKRFLEAVENSPSAKSHHALGLFYLTERKYREAAEQLEKALSLTTDDAKIRNDLGTVFLESAKQAEAEKKLELLSKALEEFEKALTLNPNLLAARFNKAVCLQEFPQLHWQTKEAWEEYLKQDNNSGWAEEARKNLEKLEQKNKTSKNKSEVLNDFLLAFRKDEKEFAWKINLQTKELITEVWLPGQLSKRFLEAKLRENEAEAQESLEALRFIGKLEKEKNADFFVADLADFYEKAEKNSWQKLLEAKNYLTEAYKFSLDSQYENSLAKLQNAKNLFAQTKNIWEEKIVLYWMAFSETNQNKLQLSTQSFEEIRSFAEKKNYKWLEALSLMRLSTNSFRLSNRSESLKLSEKAFVIFEKLQDTYNLQLVNNNQAIAFEEFKDFQKSIEYAGKSLFISDLYYESEIQKLRNFFYVSDILIKLKRFYGAIEFGKEFVKTAKNRNEDRELIYYSLIPLALSFAEVENFEESLKLLEESKNLAENIGDESKKSKLALSNLQIAEVHGKAKNYEQALTDYTLAIDLFRETPENEVWMYQAHKGKMLCFDKLQRRDELAKEIEIVLSLLEKYRGKIIEEQNRNVFFDKEQDVFDVAVEFQLKNKNLIKAFETAESVKARSLLDFMQGKALTKEEEISFANVSEPLNLAEIQRRLRDTQLVEYAVLPDKIAIWVVSKDKIEYAEKSLSKEVFEEKVRNYLEVLLNEKKTTAEMKRQSAELYELLISPILPFLDNRQAICIIPDKFLYQLPFVSLFSAQKGKYLVEEFSLYYSPSAGISVIAGENAEKKENLKNESLLAVGNPRFDLESHPNLQFLPSAEVEVQEIGKLYSANRQLLREKAVKEDLIKEITEKNIFHFAGHYVTNEASTPNSKLLLAQTSTENDLTIGEIAKLKLQKSKLVVLSACQTGIEKFYQGEGAIGIARIFLAIGTPLVVASHWQVDSEATKDLMIAFHRNRREKNLKSAEALREAQIEMLKSEKNGFQSPYFWSAFSLVGGFANY